MGGKDNAHEGGSPLMNYGVNIFYFEEIFK